jgi:ATP-dependent DNA ligase
MRINRLRAGFVVPAQPMKASKPPVGTEWVHEIKHDGYRIIVRRDGRAVRLYSRNVYDWTRSIAAEAPAPLGRDTVKQGAAWAFWLGHAASHRWPIGGVPEA